MILSKFGTDIVELFVDGKQRVENVTKETFNSRQPTRVYDKDGNVIYEYKESSYIYTELEDLKPICNERVYGCGRCTFFKP